MGCDIGKGVTRMLTPSKQQTEFVAAISPIATSLIAADLQKAQLAAAGSGYRPPPVGYPPPQYGSASGQEQPKQGLSGDDIATLVIGGGAVVVALFLLMPRRTA